MRRMYRYEPESHQRAQEHFGPMDDVSDEDTSHDALHAGIRLFPVLLEQSHSFPQVAMFVLLIRSYLKRRQIGMCARCDLGLRL